MQMIQTMVITGYRNFELGVFKEEDAKVKVIKKVIKDTLVQYLDAGLQWVLLAGNLGVELWSAQIIDELKKTYPVLKLALIYPYYSFGKQWNEKNQALLQSIEKQADYVDAVSHHEYQNPGQLKSHTHFLLTHSQATVILYDEEFSGKSKFFMHDAKKYQEEHDYFIHQITMDDLQNAVFDDSV